MNNLPVKRTYRTKKRILAEKKAKIQISINKVIILILSVVMAVGILGFARTHTDEYITSLGRVQRVHAVTIPEVETEDVETMIRRLAKEANFEWADYLVRLAKCESSLNPDAINISGNTPKGSRDRGLFQLNSYWQHQISDVEAFDAEFSTKWTMDKINAGYQSLWTCDRKI